MSMKQCMIFGFVKVNNLPITGCQLGPHPLFEKLNCLPKGRHGEATHEKRLLCAQKCTRGGVGWGMVGWVMKGCMSRGKFLKL